jgi:hypothetical protein
MGYDAQKIVREMARIKSLKKIERQLKKGCDNLPYGEAPYALMDGIDTSEKLLDAKKQLNETLKQLQMVNFLSARQIDAVNVLVKLQLCGMTDDQILNCCRAIEANDHKLNSQYIQPINSS